MQIDENEVLKWIEDSIRDIQNFEKLYNYFYKFVFIFVRSRVEEKSDAEDLTQQIFLKVMIELEKYKPVGVPFQAWLYRVAMNEVNMYYRKKSKTRLVALEESSILWMFEEINETFKEEKLTKLEHVLGDLKQEDLIIIELRFYERKEFKEIGEILSLSEAAAKMKCYRILEKLKKLFV